MINFFLILAQVELPLDTFSAEMSSVFHLFLDVVCCGCVTCATPLIHYVKCLRAETKVCNLPVITVLHQALGSSSSLFSLPVS